MVLLISADSCLLADLLCFFFLLDVSVVFRAIIDPEPAFGNSRTKTSIAFLRDLVANTVDDD